MDPNGPIALRFPLVARVRPVCLPLPARVARLAELADAAQRDAYQGLASSVFNQAALLASDLGLPDVARQWCHRHAAAYLRACPLGGMEAIRALEPLINLARLHIRAGHGDQAHRMLRSLYDAIAEGTAVMFDGITMPADLTVTEADRQEVHQWLWRVIIADGTRALTTAGRWQEALGHLQHHHGVGRRMLDGRQVAILACATTGDYDGARHLLTDTAPGEPWENEVTACLTALCVPPRRRPASHDIDTMLDHCRRLGFQPGLAVFHTRLVLSAVDAGRLSRNPRVGTQARELTDQIVQIGDGYAARDILAHQGCVSLLTGQQMRRLAQTRDACALGRRTTPPGLASALDISEAVLTRTLTADLQRPDRERANADQLAASGHYARVASPATRLPVAT
ncbi:MAG TPA: hypothetical protein VN840_15805 [Streptosporangiaceae bacterium]|nr:hypothetical protein [Streptosporangiaceae bacterium]